MNNWEDEDFSAARAFAVQYRKSLYKPFDDGIGRRNRGAFSAYRQARTPPPREAGQRKTTRPYISNLTRHPFVSSSSSGTERNRMNFAFNDSRNLTFDINAGGNTVTKSAESDSNGSQTLETSIGTPVLPEPISSNQNSFDGIFVGTADTIGRRPTMEDEMIVARHITPHYHKRIWLFGVLDGHGGPQASKFAATNWPRFLFSLLDAAGSCQSRKVRLAIETSIDQCNDALYRHLMQIGSDMNVGTTLCAVLIIDGRQLYCVNVGDSRALAITKSGKLLGALSKDHKPANPDESKRIADLGGHVTNMDGVPRVMGNLAVSRALGDFPSTPYITHKPDIIGPRDMQQVATVVICCDGVTDVLENDSIAQIVGDRVNKSNAQKAAEGLRNHAYMHYSGDNISVLVAKIK